jgi:hypothetical protein
MIADGVHTLRIAIMRLTPACGEGWKRLSLLVAVLVAIASFWWFTQQYNEGLVKFRDSCEQMVAFQKSRCGPESIDKSCYDKADEFDRHVCSVGGYPGTSERTKQWSLRALYSLGMAVIGLYLVRVTGWIFAGFAKQAST